MADGLSEIAFDESTVAALFVESNGVYSGLDNIDLWDAERDARRYAGPWPVVAHPPCARWSRLAGFTEFRFGLKRGDDGGCFKAALEAVRTYGGVLEHPAYTDAFKAFGLPKPTVKEGWTLALDGGASCYVEQGRYGLPVKKATWLYAYGCELPELRWGFTPDGAGDDIGGKDAWRDRFGGRRDAWTESPKADDHYVDGVRHRPSHLGQHSTTPPEFRDVLIGMARSVHPDAFVDRGVSRNPRVAPCDDPRCPCIRGEPCAFRVMRECPCPNCPNPSSCEAAA